MSAKSFHEARKRNLPNRLFWKATVEVAWLVAEAEAETDSKTDTVAQSDVDADTGTEADVETDAGAHTEADPGADAEDDARAESDVEASLRDFTSSKVSNAPLVRG